TKPLANVWMHNGFVKIRGDKMSKSLKNFTTIRSLLETTDSMVIRLFVLQAQYRSPIDFTDEAIAAAENGWKTLEEGFKFFDQVSNLPDWSNKLPDTLHPESVDHFNQAMDDDFNTPIALSVLFELAKDLRREKNLLIHEGKTPTPTEQLHQKWWTLIDLMCVLGLMEKRPEISELEMGFSIGMELGLSESEIETLIQQRQDARKAKNFAEGDRIRNELQANGITLIDQPGGIIRWHRA
ncbi:MAG: cysteine--tRNA ligase, partial [Leptolyngbyaceae cyanobacterium CAN_BIN12]|nr:cysteine--tRNA ligase [Leptolyngbyaceae cyanobacterium CAN_BIN12]